MAKRKKKSIATPVEQKQTKTASTSTTLPAPETQGETARVLSAAIAALKGVGVEQFVLGYSLKGFISTHLEHIPGRVASNIVVSFFHQLVEHEISQHAGNETYQNTLRALDNDFVALIKNYNVRLDAMRGDPVSNTPRDPSPGGPITK